MKWIKKQPVIEYSPDDDIITKLAKINGIKMDKLDDFMNPKANSLHSPYLLKNIELARNMILEAIESEKQISIFGDPDCDGSTALAIMYNNLKQFTNNVCYFHGQRGLGHGIKTSMNLIPKDTDLLIIVDSSTSDVEECKKIREMGINIIILDHHPSEAENPYAIIVNPQLDDYPNKNASGAVICWKMCQVIDDTLGTNYSEYLIDLAGIGCHADSMSMLEPENRYIVSEGLNRLNNLGLKAILDIKKRDMKELSTADISFAIAPMINGACRMDKMEVVTELLTCDDHKQCAKLAKEVNELNEQRKIIQAELMNKFESQINLNENFIVIIDYKNEVSKGFSGLLAGEFANKYQKHVLVLSYDELEPEKFRGSYRAFDNFKLKSFFNELSEVFYTGGHEGAGGIGIPVELINDFKDKTNTALQTIYTNKDQTIKYELDLIVDEITESLIKDIKKFCRICGKDFKDAKFMVKGLFILEKSLLGKKKDTMKISCDGLDAMKFKIDEPFYDSFPIFSEMKAVGTLNINKWYNRQTKRKVVSNQLLIDDYKII